MANDTVAPPPHVRPEQVYPFDLYHDPRLMEDLHTGYRKIQLDAPEIFYTPYNGGHWVVTRYDLIEAVLRDPANFSNREIEVPKTQSPFVALPINLDPPEHTPYRQMLMRHFTPRAAAGLEGDMHAWATKLIEQVQPQGRCDFAEALGPYYPVAVFMSWAGLPLERYVEFRKVVTEFFSHIAAERRIELQRWIFRELREVLQARIDAPRDDLFSRLVVDTVDGRKPTMDELVSIAFLLFVAGLDTVANALSFSFHFLAQHPDIQDRLRFEPDAISNYVEESMRRFPVTNGVRLIRNDLEFAGAQLRAGEMMVAPMTLAGLDDRRNPDPETFDIDRPRRQHVSFSTGPHLCIGHYIARAEMRIFIAEFIKRIPRFRLADGFKPVWRAGVVMSLESLPIVWDVQGDEASA